MSFQSVIYFLLFTIFVITYVIELATGLAKGLFKVELSSIAESCTAQVDPIAIAAINIIERVVMILKFKFISSPFLMNMQAMKIKN